MAVSAVLVSSQSPQLTAFSQSGLEHTVFSRPFQANTAQCSHLWVKNCPPRSSLHIPASWRRSEHAPPLKRLPSIDGLLQTTPASWSRSTDMHITETRCRAALGADSPRLPSQFIEIRSEEELDSILAEAEGNNGLVLIDWMAQWCRKCIYLKPKIEKLVPDYPKVRFCVVDVNAVPFALVQRGAISLWKQGKKVEEVIGGHQAWQVVDEVKDMIARHGGKR